MVGAAGRRHRRLRAGRAGALPGARRGAGGEEWLARAVKGWVGRVTAARRAGRAGSCSTDRRASCRRSCRREEHGARHWLPFTQEVAEALLELAGARLDPRALRCATRLQVGLQPAPATLSLVESYGEPRFKLDVNWDPDTVAAFAKLPAAEEHGRTIPLDPYLLEPLEFFIRQHGIDVGANALLALDKLRTEHDAAIGAVQRSRAANGDVLACEDRLGGELRPFQRAGVRYALESRRLFIADEQGLGKTVEALAAAGGGRRVPRRRHLPRLAEAQLAARDRALAAAPLAARRHGRRARSSRRPRSRCSTTRSSMPTVSASPSHARRR